MVRQTQVLLGLKRQFILFPVSGIFFLLTIVFFSGCGNSADRVAMLTHAPTGPSMSTKNVEVIFSDSGKVQAKLTSVLMNQYNNPEPYMEFPKGFHVVMYDSALRVETTISANYGKRLENTRIMEAKGNVVVRNELKKQQLNTEQLTWDEHRKMIYSNLPVKITTPDKTLYGDGLESNESFSRYQFRNVHGQMLVKKDSI